jgi:hypothetical protein
MTRAFAYFLIGAGVVLILASVFGCHQRAPAADSWAQDNLKAHDDTCRTMVYHVNPTTKELELCPPM